MQLSIRNIIKNRNYKTLHKNVLFTKNKLSKHIFLYFIGSFISLIVVFSPELANVHPIRFWDMDSTVVKWPNCFHNWGLKTFSIEANIQNMQGECWGFNYGIFSMPLYNGLAWVSQNAFLWVFLFSLASFFLIVLISPKTPSSHLFLFIIVISPPVTLLFESGNPDIINVLLCLVAGLALAHKKETIFVLCVSIVSLHKFYGIAMYILFFFGLIKREKLIKSILLFLSMGTVAIVIFYQVYFIGMQNFVDAATNHYGISIWDNYLGKIGVVVDEKIIVFIGMATLLLGTTIFIKFSPQKFIEKEKLNVAKIVSIGFYLIFLFSYMVVNNVDYRLIFLCAALILDSEHVLSKTGLFKIYQLLIAASLYFVYPFGYSELVPGAPVQVLGDISLHIVAMFCLARVFYLLLQLKNDMKVEYKNNL